MLSAALRDGNVGHLVARGVEPEMFAQPDVAKVFQWARDHSRRYGAPSDALVRQVFPDWRPAFSSDSFDFLVDEFLAEVIRRAFIETVMELSDLERNDPDGFRANRARLSEILFDKARLLASRVPTGQVAMFSQELALRIEAYENEHGRYRPGTPMGLPVIDQTMGGGIKSGWLITIAGFSGFGKSFLGGHAALSTFEDDKRALFLSLEMSRQEVIERLDTMVMNWNHSALQQRQLSVQDRERWKSVAAVYSRAKGEIIVKDKLSDCSIDRVHAEIERYRPDVCVIDYVQRMRSVYSSRRPRHEQLEEITNELKTVAMDTDTAIVMISQDGRDAAEQGSTRSNMGGSISVYQAADAYIGMQQDEAMRGMNKMRLKLLKFRHGPSCEVDVVWDPSRGDFGRLYRSADQFVKPSVMGG